MRSAEEARRAGQNASVAATASSAGAPSSTVLRIQASGPS
jgi:hypothetical protein